MSWRGHLALHYWRDGPADAGRTVAHDLHEGPLRVLQRLYPEGPDVCHHVLVHPPGGIVGGDHLQIDARLDEGAHALITTPGATRFYRSTGAQAVQSATLRLAAGARLEWLPLETIAFDGCLAANHLRIEPAPGAEAMGWEVLALGLPAAGAGFERGSFEQRLEVPGVWLERGRVDASDRRLLDSPLGWAGQRVLVTLWFVAGSALAPARTEALLEAAQAAIANDALHPRAGVTLVQPSVLLMRVLAPRVEPAMALLGRVRTAWRRIAWDLPGNPPRIWRT